MYNVSLKDDISSDDVKSRCQKKKCMQFIAIGLFIQNNTRVIPTKIANL